MANVNLLTVADLRTTLVLDDEVLGISDDHTTEIRAKFSVLKDLIAEDNLAAIQANEAAISANASNIASLSVFADVTSVVSGDYVTGYNAAGDTLQRITAAKLSTSLAALIEDGGVVSIGGTQVLAQAGGIATVGVSANTRTQLYGDVHTAAGNTGLNCNFVGRNAGINNSGNNCVAIGFFSLNAANSGGNNVALGNQALSSNTTGANNLGVGYKALFLNTAGIGNIANGYEALYNNLTGNYNIGYGYHSLYSITSGNNNIGSGYRAGRYQTGGTTALTNVSNSLFLGDATKGVQGASNQIVIGSEAESLGANTVALGNSSITLTQLRGNVQTSTGNTGLDCNFVGSGAGLNNSGNNCVGLGYETLNSGNSGYENIAIGSKALYSNSTGEYNVAIGYQTLYNNLSGFYNVSNGFLALNKNTTGGYNVAIGYSALYHNTTGNNNIAIGYNAGREQSTFAALTTASSSLFLGATTKGVQGATNQIVIGDNAESIGANTVVLGNANIVTTVLRGNVGIGTNTPNANAILDVSSTTKAFLPPRMTTSQKNAVASPTAGMVVYDSTLDKLSLRDGTDWKTLSLDVDAPVLSGAEPAQVDIMSGASVVVNTSGWFSGTVTHYVMSVPSGMNFDFFTGVITGQVSDGVVPDLVVRAYNGRSYVEHTVSLNIVWSLDQAQAEAKGWYDTLTPTTLKTDLVASFADTSSEYLSISHASQTGLEADGAFSVTGWVKATPRGEAQGIVGKYLTTAGGAWQLVVWANDNYRLEYTENGATYLSAATATAVGGTWQHFAVSYDGVNLRLRINGSLIVGPAVNLYASSTHNFVLGRRSSGNFLGGDLSAVAYWNRDLSSVEVNEIMALGVGYNPENYSNALKVGGVSAWPLNEPRGMRYDRWGTNHLTDNNTVGAAHGPVEYQADNYAGITRWENQGTAASPYGAFVEERSGRINAQLLDGGVEANDVSFETIPGISIPQPYTIVIVTLMEGTGGSNDVIIGSSTSDILTIQGNAMRVLTSDSGNQPTNIDRTGKQVAFMHHNGSASYFELDGDVYNYTANYELSSTRINLMGNWVSNGGIMYKSPVYAALFFPRELTTSEKAAITSYFA